jgi:Ca2+-binding RTX toxin-like protein
MATITETNDATINAYASGSYTIGFDDTFEGSYGPGDTEDGINLPVLQAGTQYTITVTVDDISDFTGLVLINPNNFHSFGYHVTDGVPHDESVYVSTFGQRDAIRVIGNTIEFDFTPYFDQRLSFQVQGTSSITENYTVSIAETPVPPVVTEDADVVIGEATADSLSLLGGDDQMNAGDGDDTVYGDGGNDVIYGEAGADLLSGNQGNDLLDGGADADTLLGESGNDTLMGGAGADSLKGGNDNDVLSGDEGADVLEGEKGDDSLSGGSENDTLIGGDGDDTMDGGTGNDTFVIGVNSGNDVVQNFELGTDVIDVTALNIYAVAQMTITETGGDTTIDFGNGSSVTLSGVSAASVDASAFALADSPYLVTAGRDRVTGEDSADVVDAGAGDDIIKGNGGNDILIGGDGRDAIFGGDDNDTIDGGNDSDALRGDNGDDSISGGSGNDNLRGGEGNDVLDGGADNDRLEGGNGNDDVSGGSGHDWVFGDAGMDTVSGGEGRDNLTGGADADVFVFETNTNHDTILDFEDGLDMIDLTGLSGAGITQFTDLVITDDGVNATIALDGGNTVTVNNTLAVDLDATDFLF